MTGGSFFQSSFLFFFFFGEDKKETELRNERKGGYREKGSLTSRWFAWADKAVPLQGKLSFETWSFASPFTTRKGGRKEKSTKSGEGKRRTAIFAG